MILDGFERFLGERFRGVFADNVPGRFVIASEVKTRVGYSIFLKQNCLSTITLRNGPVTSQQEVNA